MGFYHLASYTRFTYLLWDIPDSGFGYFYRMATAGGKKLLTSDPVF